MQFIDNHPILFHDREDAGHQLAPQVINKFSSKPVAILALPRGGVPVALPLAESLHAPLEVMVVRKLGAPFNPELGIGAIAEYDTIFIDASSVKKFRISQEELDQIIAHEKEELVRRVSIYRDGKPLPQLNNFHAILVDDGLATGVTAIAAIRAVKKLHPMSINFAVPVCAFDTAETLRSRVHALYCILSPDSLGSIGSFYSNFSQTTDEEVLHLLQESREKYGSLV